MGPLFRTIVGLVFGGIVSRLLWVVGHFRTSRLATRRTFVRNAALGATGMVGTITAAGFGALMWPNKTGAFGSVLTVGADQVPAVGAEPFRHTAGRFYLVHNEDGLLALYTKCPHLGCTVPYVGPADAANAFQCPCHGSLYDFNGDRTGGPAPRPMDMMAVTVEGDNVSVDTGDIRLRAAYSPDQTVPFQA